MLRNCAENCNLSSNSFWRKKLFELRVTLHSRKASLQQSEIWKSPGELLGKTISIVLWVPVLKGTQGEEGGLEFIETAID